MVRLYVVLGVIAVAFYVFSIVDCALYDSARVRVLPKTAWVFIVLIPLVGGGLWFIFGRSRRGSTGAPARAAAPDDDPEFLGRIGRDQELEARIRRLERELSDLDDKGGDSDKPGRSDA